MKYKICGNCKEELSEDNFYKHNRKDGLYWCCKNCMKIFSRRGRNKSRQYYLEHKEKKIQYQKKYSIENKKKLKEKQKEYRKKNRVRMTKNKRKWRENNRERENKKTRKYCLKNKERINKYGRERRQNNIKIRITKKISTILYNHLRGMKARKKWQQILGYDTETLINHLSATLPQGYKLSDCGARLHIDHIIPVSLYDIKSITDIEFKKCWALKNLHFLEARENLKKHNKISTELIEKYNLFDILPKKLEGVFN